MYIGILSLYNKAKYSIDAESEAKRQLYDIQKSNVIIDNSNLIKTALISKDYYKTSFIVNYEAENKNDLSSDLLLNSNVKFTIEHDTL